MRATFKRLEMGVRATMPRAVRQLYRMARSAGGSHLLARQLPAALVDGCEMCASRYDMLSRLPKGGTCAEIGTDKGDFAREILSRAEPARLHVIDIDYSRFDKTLLADARVKKHQGLSHQVIAGFPDNHFDWIYIDADHSYDGVLRDAKASAAKLKPGGLMIFNDFAHIDPELGRYGVQRAVVDFALEKRWPLRYFAFHPAALYDVALKKV